jgi:hypothetical protein
VTHKNIHLLAAIGWILLIIPTLLWWRDSVLWVIIISIYANIVGHWSAWEAAKAAEREKNELASAVGEDPSVSTKPESFQKEIT